MSFVGPKNIAILYSSTVYVVFWLHIQRRMYNIVRPSCLPTSCLVWVGIGAGEYNILSYTTISAKLVELPSTTFLDSCGHALITNHKTIAAKEDAWMVRTSMLLCICLNLDRHIA